MRRTGDAEGELETQKMAQQDELEALASCQVRYAYSKFERSQLRRLLQGEALPILRLLLLDVRRGPVLSGTDVVNLNLEVFHDSGEPRYLEKTATSIRQRSERGNTAISSTAFPTLPSPTSRLSRAKRGRSTRLGRSSPGSMTPAASSRRTLRCFGTRRPS